MEKKSLKMRIGPVANALLLTIGTLGVVTVAVVAPNVFQILGPFFKKKKYSRDQSLQRNVQSLLRSGLIEYVKSKDGDKELRLTKRGKFEYLLRKGSVSITNKHAKWDGIWRVIIFDVPNKKEKIRNELRRAMKMYGFKQLQRSVWVYPFLCDDFITIVKSHLGVSNDVLSMHVSHIENDKHLRTAFKI